MNIVTILGSPQKNGSSTAIAKRFNAEAEKNGATVQTFNLNTMDFKGCQGCHLCKTKREDCAIQDDLTEVLAAIHKADAVVFASPVYFFEISGQLKTFLDRTFSFIKPNFFERPDPCRLEPGKKSLFILTQGQNLEEYGNIIDNWDYILKVYGFEDRRVVRCGGLHDKRDDDLLFSSYVEAENIAREFTA